jgi:aminopeptidase N
MRILLSLIFFHFFVLIAIAQSDCKQIDDIVFLERLSHQRLEQRGDLTQASGNFDVKYYRAEWEVDPAIRYIKGKLTCYFQMLLNGNSLSLDLMNGLTVDSIKQRNSSLSFTHTNNLLQLNFSNAINAGIVDSISVYYKGVPPNTGFGSFENTTHAGTPVVWTLSEPYGSRDWWPCKNGLDDKADSLDVFITCPVAYKAASNGILQSETIINAGTKRLAWWKHRYPIASYLVCFAVTNYSVFNNSVQLGSTNLPMQTYCYPENLAAFQSGTPNTLAALKQFHDLFGDYPFINEKYGHVQFSWGGGMEHQTSTFVVNAGESLTAHELAHQWFGDKITCSSWEDIWLNEGFATHLASIYMETKYPANVINWRKSDINYITSQTGGSVWVNDTSSVGRIFDGRLSYTKGSYLLYMLRWILGDSVFFKGIRQYQKDPAVAYGFAKTTDLKRNLEQVSGKDLTYFFDDWFKGQGYPTYNVQWSQLGDAYVKIKMNQSSSHSSVPFFELPVALVFKNASQQKTIIVDNKINGEIFLKEIGFRADTVLIDPEYWLVTKNNVSQKITDNVSGQNIVQVFPNPIKSRFFIYLRNFNASLLNGCIYNVSGQLVWKQTITLTNGSQFLPVNSSFWSAGIYQLVIRDQGKILASYKLLR